MPNIERQKRLHRQCSISWLVIIRCISFSIYQNKLSFFSEILYENKIWDLSFIYMCFMIGNFFIKLNRLFNNLSQKNSISIFDLMWWWHLNSIQSNQCARPRRKIKHCMRQYLAHGPILLLIVSDTLLSTSYFQLFPILYGKLT